MDRAALKQQDVVVVRNGEQLLHEPGEAHVAQIVRRHVDAHRQLRGDDPAQAQTAAPPAPKTLPPYVAWKDAEQMIVHTGTTIETKRSAFGTSIVTPADRLYIRNNLPAPDVSIVANPDAWTVDVQGVRNPRTLTVAELKSMGIETVAAVLQCSGNGRSYFASKPSGTKWQVGAAGCVIWSGVPVRAPDGRRLPCCAIR